MSRIVRASKYRHVFGAPFKKENCLDDLTISRSAWDTNFCCVNGLYFAVIWEAGGGGSFAVIPNAAVKGKFDPKTPLVAGHKAPVLDIQFNPFNDALIASVSEDCTGKIWGIPEGGLKSALTEPLITLNGHKRKVGTCNFNPVANNVLATSSADFSIKIWDIERGAAFLSVDAQHTDLIQCADWNDNGSLLASTCKDKKLRVVDPRTNKVVQEGEGHAGVKGSRLIWLGRNEKFCSVGFTKTSERELAVWDPRDLSKSLTRQSLDSSSGTIMPFFDRDCNILFLAGKGDGNIRYYEAVDDDKYLYYLTEYKTSQPQRGMCMLPKKNVNVSENEIDRLLKLGNRIMEPVSFQVPRKSDIFQDDIFPDCYSGEPALTLDQWAKGQNASPKTQTMAPGFVQKERKAEFNPVKQEEKVMSDKEMKEEIEKLTQRVAYLEAELIKRDARIKELQG